MTYIEEIPRSDETSRELLRRAFSCALSSEVPTTQTGAYIAALEGGEYRTLVEACNSVVAGVRDTYMDLRTWRDVYIEHAERNAIYAAARHGIRVGGALLVCTWLPCVECARAIVQAGIVEILVPESEYPEHWAESIVRARRILEEAGVKITVLVGGLGGCENVRRMGVSIAP
jgi:dCMP deaminase